MEVLLWSTVLGVCTDVSPKPSFLRQSYCQAPTSSFSSLHGICLRPGGGGSFPPLRSRQFADLLVFLPRTLCQGALSHFPSKEEDVSASGRLAEAARSQFVAHGEGFLFPVILYIYSCLQADHSCKVFTFRGKCITRYASLLD